MATRVRGLRPAYHIVHELKKLYSRRQVIVEPVFGQIKEDRGFRRFSLRGLKKIRGEWSLVCLPHNLLKVWRYGYAPQTAEADKKGQCEGWDRVLGGFSPCEGRSCVAPTQSVAGLEQN